MATTPSGFSSVMSICPTIQGRLKDDWDTGIAFQDLPHLQFLASKENQRTVKQKMIPGNGHIKKFELVFTPRLPKSLLLNNQPNPNCTGVNFIGENTEQYELNTSLNLQYSEQITLEQMEQNCGSEDEFVYSRILAIMDLLDRGTAQKSAEQSVAGTGEWSKTIPFGDLPGRRNNSKQLVLNTILANGNINPQGMMILDNALRDSGYPEAYVFGGDTGRLWMQQMNAGCCSASGQNLKQVFDEHGKAFAHDMEVAAALGSQKELLILASGAHQLLNFTRANAKWSLTNNIVAGGLNSNYVSVVMQSPATGVMYDFNFKDDCGVLNIVGTSTTRVITLPNTLYVAADPYYRINGSFQAVVVNASES